MELLDFKNYVNEKFEKIKNQKWVDWDLKSLSDDELKIIWKMYEDTYKAEGMELSANGFSEMQGKYTASFLIDVDNDQIPDAFIIYRDTKFGMKIALLGSNGKKPAKSKLVKQMFAMLKSKSNPCFIEASLKTEVMLSQSDVPPITDDELILAILGPKKKPEMKGDGYYDRFLTKANFKITKRMYGHAKK